MSKIKDDKLPPTFGEEIKKLAKLSAIDYDRVRKLKAKEFNIQLKTLDAEVRKAKGEKEQDLQGGGILFPKTEPWPDEVNGAEVLDAIAKRVGQYVALPAGADSAIALWCAHAHIFDEFMCSPRLNIKAPSAGCGKTTLRDVTGEFVPRALPTENLTSAVLFRLVEEHTPTILADEYDAWMRVDGELRGLFNASHRRGGFVLRCVGDDNDVRRFKTFAPVVLSGIGKLPATLIDRSIIIELTKAKPGEVSMRYDIRRNAVERELLRKLVRWTNDIRKIVPQDPALPESASNRVADNWRPLFAIAEGAGGKWPERCAKAFELLTGEGDEADNIGVELLRDIRCVWQDEKLECSTVFHVEIEEEAPQKKMKSYRPSGAKKIFTQNLIDALQAIEESPWKEAKEGKEIDDRWLSRKLKEFKIKSKQIRIGEKTKKGFELKDFEEAFERYLLPQPEIAENEPRLEVVA